MASIPFVGPLAENPITGTSAAKTGVTGSSNMGVGVLGACVGGPGADVTPASDGVMGIGKNGVHGQSASPTDSGVWGENTGAGVGVAGSSVGGNGVQGTSASAASSGVLGVNTGGGNAGEFNGAVKVTGDLNVGGDIYLTGPGMDCAEEFETADSLAIEPGTVVVIDYEGTLRESREAYDRKVAGVISGAGEYRPAIVLGKGPSNKLRVEVALVGKVYCKVDAQYASIEMGDLLTTSPTPGHAMKAIDPGRAFGAVIGKALRPLRDGRGMVPVLVALQ